MSKKGETHQFSLDEDVEETVEGLDQERDIPKILEERFLEEGCSVQGDALVWTEKGGEKWRVKGDADKVYRVKREGEKLNVYSEPLWHIIASREVKSRIYLSLIGREMNARKIEDELGKDKGRTHFEGYDGSYVRDIVNEMEKEGLLQKKVGESETSGRGRNLVYLYEADIGVYLNYLDRNTDSTKSDNKMVGEIITKAISKILNQAAKEDTKGSNAILDISLLAAAPDFFFEDASLSQVKDRFRREIEKALKGYERDIQAYLSPLIKERYEPKIIGLIDRLSNFQRGGTEISDEMYRDFKHAFPYFLQVLVAVSHDFEEWDEDLY